MAQRFYSNSASTGTITSTLNNTDASTLMTLTAPLVGWPSTPCIAAVSYGQSDEEIVLVTSISGSTVTATRGYDGSAKRAHTPGASLTHVSSAIDLAEANAHVNTLGAVHGVTGNLVGTTDAQTLSNKTLIAPTVASFLNAQHDHGTAAAGGLIPQTSITGLSAMFATKADNAAVVHSGGNETISGNKTFTGTTALGVTNVSGALIGTSTVQGSSVNGTAGLTRNGKSAWARDDIAVGSWNAPTDNDGYLTVTHNAGFTPSKVFVQQSHPTGGAILGFTVVTAITATTFTIRILLIQGTLPAGDYSGFFMCVK